MFDQGSSESASALTSWLGHSVSLTALIGVVAGFFTPLAAVITTCWFGLQIWESQTVQELRRNRKARKLEKLRDQIAKLEKN